MPSPCKDYFKNEPTVTCHPGFGRCDFQPHSTGQKTQSVNNLLKVTLLINGRGGLEARFLRAPMLVLEVPTQLSTPAVISQESGREMLIPTTCFPSLQASGPSLAG